MTRTIGRRRFLKASAGIVAGASSVFLERPPAFAQKRELTFLTFNHFVPASDDELRRQAEVFAKQAGVTVRVDTIAGPQLFAKRAAQATSQSGHDLIVTGAADPFLYEQQLTDMGDLVAYLGDRYGGWYPFATQTCQTSSGWRAVPWFWVAFPGCYNETHFKKAGVQPPKTWEDLLKVGKVLKKQGNPVGIPISHCTDANISFWCSSRTARRRPSTATRRPR
jgi:multiple sugar transport system substrate-binding protein